jgi:signal transduction histidine kinase
MTRTRGGTGLGLAIAEQSVEMHRGRTWVESTMGMSAIFQIEVPAAPNIRRPAI